MSSHLLEPVACLGCLLLVSWRRRSLGGLPPIPLKVAFRSLEGLSPCKEPVPLGLHPALPTVRGCPTSLLGTSGLIRPPSCLLGSSSRRRPPSGTLSNGVLELLPGPWLVLLCQGLCPPRASKRTGRETAASYPFFYCSPLPFGLASPLEKPVPAPQ